MGKAARWLKGLLGLRKEKSSEENYNAEIWNSISVNGNKKDKKRWSFSGKSGKGSEIAPHNPGNIRLGDTAWLKSYVAETENEQNKHAIAVAAATAAAADAAVAAAQAAVAVVRLTSNGRGALFGGGRERWAAMKIQSVFRGYLARKALRALKGLVKIQALVRGYLVRKRTAATLHSIQALIRAQATVRSKRLRRSRNQENRLHPDLWLHRRSTGRYEDPRGEMYSKRLSASIDMNSLNKGYDYNSPKIVEMDTYKPTSRSRRMTHLNLAFSECGDDLLYQSVSSPLLCQVPSRQTSGVRDFEWCFTSDDCKFPTAQSTPRFAAPPTPAKTVCRDGWYFGDIRPYSNCHPNYMAKTQSSKAKVRSQSAPKQRPEPNPKKRLSLNEIMAARNSVSGVRMPPSYYCSQYREGASHF